MSEAKRPKKYHHILKGFKFACLKFTGLYTGKTRDEFRAWFLFYDSTRWVAVQVQGSNHELGQAYPVCNRSTRVPINSGVSLHGAFCELPIKMTAKRIHKS
jgi:hypothetical protein